MVLAAGTDGDEEQEQRWRSWGKQRFGMKATTQRKICEAKHTRSTVRRWRRSHARIGPGCFYRRLLVSLRARAPGSGVMEEGQSHVCLGAGHAYPCVFGAELGLDIVMAVALVAKICGGKGLDEADGWARRRVVAVLDGRRGARTLKQSESGRPGRFIKKYHDGFSLCGIQSCGGSK